MSLPPRFRLAHLPTPVEPLPRLTAALNGPRLWIKRDDLTGLAGGGNKARKLEFLVADAQARGADSLITLGAPQSNHCRQTAAAAARAGMRCTVVLSGNPPQNLTGNLLLDTLLGAEMRWAGGRTREEVMGEVVAEAQAAGRRPYPIPLGGSTGLGALGYALAMAELVEQQSATGLEFDRVAFASSSGGTHAGMLAGAAASGFGGQVLGISVDEPLEVLRPRVAQIAAEAARRMGSPRAWSPEAVAANADYLGGGYAVLGEPEREAIRLFARYEGILLDPVYTGRAAAGLLDLIRRGAIGADETVLFWHTGGTPALWAYADGLRD